MDAIHHNEFLVPFKYITFSHIFINQNVILDSKRSYYITLKFLQLSTECAYDYIYVYDGASNTNSVLLGSFSGKDSAPIRALLAESGSMRIVLFR